MQHSDDYGLTAAEVEKARRQFGRNELSLHTASVWTVLKRQLASPLLVILLVTIFLSYSLGDHVNAGIILAILTVSVSLGFINEYSSEKTVTDLLKKVSLSASVIRHGIKQDIPVAEVTVGDVVLLHRGTVVPADLVLLESDGLAADESALTGESLPAAKAWDAHGSRERRLYMGTVVAAGCGKGKVAAIAHDTEFGRLMEGAAKFKEKTAFQKGLGALSAFMTKVITVMALGICLVNIALGRDPFQAVLFALAVAIGLTPALLPVIVTVCMARGAHRMARRNVVVKRLVGIEDLGNMDVLCTDKTGTLTEGAINLTGHYSMNGRPSLEVMELAVLCNTASHHHKIIGNPMDVAILQYAHDSHIKPDYRYKKVAEEEFNYDVRGQFCVVERGGKRTLVFKGAADAVLDRCRSFTDETGQLVPIGSRRETLRKAMQDLNKKGLRLILVGRRAVEAKPAYAADDAVDLQLVGYLTFLDVPKHSAKHALDRLKALGVDVKIVTGDNELVTRTICDEIRLEVSGILTGPELAKLKGKALKEAVASNSVFARVTPEQKEEIILQLKEMGRTVGYMGDGINDAGALKAADVGLSVNTAVDVAKDVAGVVLLQKGLDVIAEGVVEGRRIFANTIKYILMGTSSNFGNMFSVAGASFFLPFLPMTPSQILLNNSLYDLSQLGIPSDDVDDEELLRPRRWDIRAIYRYMLFFGPISSAFDYASFAVLWFGFHGSERHFQTGWFLESLLTQVLVVFVIRTARPFFRSRPGGLLLGLCGFSVALALALPFSPVAEYLHFTAMPGWYAGALAGLVVAYLGITETVKRRFLAAQ